MTGFLQSRYGATAWRDSELEDICKLDGRFWGFAYVKPKTEKKVRVSLQGKGVVCYLPLMPKARLHHSTKIVTQVPMIPSYLFLCIREEERGDLKRAESQVIQIELIRDARREECFIRELNILRKCEELARERPVLVKPEIAAGDDIMIISGPLKGLRAKVLRRDDEQNAVVINFSILNTSIEYSFSMEELKKIT